MLIRRGIAAGVAWGLVGFAALTPMGCGTDDKVLPGTGGASTTASSSGDGGASTSSGMGGKGGTGGMGTGGMASGGASSSSASSSSSGGVQPCDGCLKPIWKQAVMGPKDQVIHDIALDTLAGNVVIVGSIGATSNFIDNVCSVDCALPTAGGNALYVARLDPVGKPMWAESVGNGDIYSEANSVAIDSQGNILIAGRFKGSIQFPFGPQLNSANPATYDIFVAKFTSLGTPLWSKRFGDVDDQHVGGVAVDGVGNVIVTGSFLGTMDFGPGAGCTALTSMGSFDAYVAKLDGFTGACLRSRRYGDAAEQQIDDVAVDTLGNIIVVGHCKGSWLMDGTSMECGAGTSDVFAAKFDAKTGNASWAHTWGGEDQDKEGEAVAIDSSGNVFITGRFKGDLDFGAGDNPAMSASAFNAFVAQLAAADGNALWSRHIPADGDDSPEAITVGNGNVYVAGATDAAITLCGNKVAHAGATDAYIVSFDTAGQCLCGRTYGDGAAQKIKALAFGANGALVLGAEHQGVVDLDCMTSMTSVEANDVLITRMSLMP